MSATKEKLSTRKHVEDQNVLIHPRLETYESVDELNISTSAYLKVVELARGLGAKTVKLFEPDGEDAHDQLEWADAVVRRYGGDDRPDWFELALDQEVPILEFGWDGLGGRWFFDRYIDENGDEYDMEDNQSDTPVPIAIDYRGIVYDD